MERKKYRIVVLADLKKSVSTTLKTAVSIAKIIDGEIDFFYVKNAAKVVVRDNQLSAIRSIKQDYTATDKKIKKLVESVSNEYQININYSFAFGNVKHEIDHFIKEHKPDMVVLGKKKSNPLSLIGDKMVQFVLKQYSGSILIADAHSSLEPNNKLLLGILNNFETTLNNDLTKNLLIHTQKPIKSFQIVKKINSLADANSSNANTIDYVFEQNDNSINNLSTYITKNNINLLLMDRMENNSRNNSNLVKQNIKDISKLKVSILLAGERNNTLQH